jgi:HlyD family secretion protein
MLAGALLVAGAGFAAYTLLRGREVAVLVVQRGDLVQSVVASGHVESQYRVDIASQITGTVAQVAVKEGDSVRQGQVLVVLASAELAGNGAQARALVAQAAAQLRAVQEVSLPTALQAQASAAASLRGTQVIYDRTAALLKDGFATRTDFDAAQKQRDMARALLSTTDAQVRSAQGQGADRVAAQAVLAQARSAQTAALARLGYTLVLAPRDGVLISRSVEQGSVAVAGVTLMVLAPTGAGAQLILQIDERNLARIAVGQGALASADAYPDRPFAARVVYINPGIDIARASATVKLAVPLPPAFLRQDMTVSVDIETARARGALVLPMAAVHDALSGAPWVMVVADGRAERRGVALGLRGVLQVQIVRGLVAGDRVIPASSTITAGLRVAS